MNIIIYFSVITYLALGCWCYYYLSNCISTSSMPEENKQAYYAIAANYPLVWFINTAIWILLWPLYMRKLLWALLVYKIGRCRSLLIRKIAKCKFIWLPIRHFILFILSPKFMIQAYKDAFKEIKDKRDAI